MAYVLKVTTLQFCNPVVFVIFVKACNWLFHSKITYLTLHVPIASYSV